MSRCIRSAAAALLLAAALPAAAQSADQEVVSVVDSPDPVVPGQNITYTVTLRNNGPDAAVNGGLNAIIDQNITFTLPPPNLPAGFSCARFGQAVSCTTPSFAPGTVTITLVGQLSAHLNAFPDGSVSSMFSTSGTTPDPNNGNNQGGAVTAYNSPQVDLTIAVTDNPDPVRPDETITYTATVTNDGPDPATNVNFNVFNNGSLRFQSVTPGAGFACNNPPPVGGNPQFTCSRATVPVGTYTFTVVVLADDAVLGANDGTVSTVFSIGAGASNETDQSDNSETEDTLYVTPDADLSVTVVDGPDPATVEDAVDFLVTVSNAGPDPATPVRLNIVGDGGLQFVAIDPADGFSCTAQGVGATPLMTCTGASLAVGASAEFLVTLRSDEDVLGEDGGTVMTLFGANSNLTDPVNANNNETESTTVVAFRLFRDGFEG